MLKFFFGILIGAILHSAYLVMLVAGHSRDLSNGSEQLVPVTLAGMLKPGEVYRITGYGVYDGKTVVSINLEFAPDSKEIWTYEPDLATQPLGTRFRLHDDGIHLFILGSHEA